MWPTPQTVDYKYSGANVNWQRAADKCRLPGQVNVHGGTKTLQTYPTPKASIDGTSQKTLEMAQNGTAEMSLIRKIAIQDKGQLNPDWVEWLMNWPIKWTSLEALNYEYLEYWKKASTTGVQRPCGMQEMWFDNDVAEAPYRPQPIKQCTKKHSNTLCQLSWRDSRKRKMERPQKGEGVCLLWKKISLQESKGNDMLIKLCQQTCLAKAKIIPRVATNIPNRVDRLKAIGNGQVPQCVALAYRLLTKE